MDFNMVQNDQILGWVFQSLGLSFSRHVDSLEPNSEWILLQISTILSLISGRQVFIDLVIAETR